MERNEFFFPFQIVLINIVLNKILVQKFSCRSLKNCIVFRKTCGQRELFVLVPNVLYLLIFAAPCTAESQLQKKKQVSIKTWILSAPTFIKYCCLYRFFVLVNYGSQDAPGPMKSLTLFTKTGHRFDLSLDTEARERKDEDGFSKVTINSNKASI